MSQQGGSPAGLAVGPGQHGVEQHVHARHCVVELGVLRLVVRDAVAAGREDHRGGRDARDVVRVVAGLAEDVAVRDVQALGRLADEADAAGVITVLQNRPASIPIEVSGVVMRTMMPYTGPA